MEEAPSQPPTVSKPWWQQKTSWAGIAAVLLALPSFVEQVAPFLNEQQRAKAMALATLAAALAAVFARMGGVAAAKVAAGEVLEATISTPANRIEGSVLRAVREKLEL